MRFRCGKCGTWPKDLHEFEADAPVCPRCGAAGSDVLPLVDVHFLAIAAKGPILGMSGRHLVACEPARPYLAQRFGPVFSATPDPRAVTCPRCKGSKEFLEAIKPYEDLVRARALAKEAQGNPVTDCGCGK